MIKVDGRMFIVTADEAGIRIIKERVLYNEGHPYLERWVNVPRWHRATKPIPKRGYISRVIEQWRLEHEKDTVHPIPAPIGEAGPSKHDDR